MLRLPLQGGQSVPWVSMARAADGAASLRGEFAKHEGPA